jgi:hypothetical protein
VRTLTVRLTNVSTSIVGELTGLFVVGVPFNALTCRPIADRLKIRPEIVLGSDISIWRPRTTIGSPTAVGRTRYLLFTTGGENNEEAVDIIHVRTPGIDFFA